MRNILRCWAILALVSVSSIACGSKDKPVRVAVFTTDPILIKIMGETFKSIEKKHPGLKVRVDNIPYTSYRDKITVQAAAGNAPDVISVEASTMPDLYMRGLFEDLTPLFERDGLKKSDYYPTVFRRFNPGGKITAIPTDIAPTGLLYYNKKLLKEAGVPYPGPAWKWPEPFLTYCKKLTKKDQAGKIVQWAYADPYGPNADIFMLSNGAYWMDSETKPTRLTLDDPRTLEAYMFRWGLIHKHHVSPTLPEIQAFNFGNGAEDMFANGMVAMMTSGVWHTPRFAQKTGLDYDVVEFPKGPRGTQGWGSGGSAVAIPKGSKNLEKAWMVVKELAGADLVTQLAATGMIQPALVKVAESDAFLKSPGPRNKRILLTMPKHAHFAPFIKNWNEVWDGNVGPALDQAWLGKKTPAEILPKLNKDLNKRFFPLE